MANTAPISSSSLAGPSATTSDSDGSSSAGAAPLLARRPDSTLHTHTNLNTTPSILRDMMREFLATTTVLCALATVRPHSRTNRTNRCVKESVALFVCWEG